MTMNEWFRRGVAGAGMAGAVLLLGAATVHPDVSAPAAVDPQELRGVFDDLLKPAGGPALGDTHARGVDAPNMIGDDFVDQSPYAGPLLPDALDSVPALDSLTGIDDQPAAR
jgi:hypothetical protein